MVLANLTRRKHIHQLAASFQFWLTFYAYLMTPPNIINRLRLSCVMLHEPLQDLSIDEPRVIIMEAVTHTCIHRSMPITLTKRQPRVITRPPAGC